MNPATQAPRRQHSSPGASPSPAGPADPDEPINEPPTIPLPRPIQVLRFSRQQTQFVFRARRDLGEVFQMRAGVRPTAIVTCHPDHARSLFIADPALVPSITAESPLRPIVGPSSVLTANGERHLRQRKLLLPCFHGDAIERYIEMITAVAEREIDRWPLHREFELSPRMQAITSEVILSGIFGIDGPPQRGSAENRLRITVRYLAAASTTPVGKVAELWNLGRTEPVGLTRIGLGRFDRAIYPIIAARRSAGDLTARTDILSLLLTARTEQGDPLTDRELRDELITLVFAGFETTANSLAWTWERLLRTPDAYETLRHAVRSGEDAAEHVEATILEGMRCRPVVPIIGRRVAVPWRLGDYVVPAGSAISISVLLLHHREDLYPDPFAFRPDRWLGRKPGTYEWIPFGGGTRRCLGAQLAMAEQRVVLSAMARRLDLKADRPEPERTQNRIVTMIPARATRVRLVAREA